MMVLDLLFENVFGEVFFDLARSTNAERTKGGGDETFDNVVYSTVRERAEEYRVRNTKVNLNIYIIE